MLASVVTLLCLLIHTHAQVLSVQGPIVSVTPVGLQADIVIFTATGNVACRTTPTTSIVVLDRTLTVAQLSDATPLPGRTEPGFLGALTSVTADPDATGALVCLTISTVPEESTIAGYCYQDPVGTYWVEGMKLIETTEPRLPDTTASPLSSLILPVLPGRTASCAFDGYYSPSLDAFIVMAAAVDLVTPLDVPFPAGACCVEETGACVSGEYEPRCKGTFKVGVTCAVGTCPAAGIAPATVPAPQVVAPAPQVVAPAPQVVAPAPEEPENPGSCKDSCAAGKRCNYCEYLSSGALKYCDFRRDTCASSLSINTSVKNTKRCLIIGTTTQTVVIYRNGNCRPSEISEVGMLNTAASSCTVQDVNKDGRLELLCKFTVKIPRSAASSRVKVHGVTKSGIRVYGWVPVCKA